MVTYDGASGREHTKCVTSVTVHRSDDGNEGKRQVVRYVRSE